MKLKHARVPHSFVAWILWSGLCLLPAWAEAGVIAVLKDSNLAAYSAPIAAFEKGVNARVVVYDLNGDLEKGKQLAQQLAQVPPDLILALGAKSAYSAKKYVTQVPIVYALVINPEKFSLAQPNVTGINLEVPPETVFTQYRMFAPGISRVGVIYSPATEALVNRAEQAIAPLGIKLVRTLVNEPGEVEAAFGRIQGNIDSLWMVPDSVALTQDTFRLLLARTAKVKLPYLAFSENFVKAGALISVSPDYAAIGSQAASLARQILDEKQAPSSIPPMAPIGTHLTVNVDTARQLELKLDPLVLDFADELIGTPPTQGSAVKSNP
ncbi:MAG: ABC transporter substrate-binding protein [Myxococcota bacterium]